MAIKLTTTSDSINFVKCLVFGESGVGKTWLCQTAPSPVIISAEKGLLTLKDVKIPVIEISSFSDLEDAYVFLTTDKRAKKFQTICLDSISDIAETVLAEEKENCGADPRQAYGAYQDKLLPMIKKFRDIDDKHVYFTAKMKRIVDDFSGITAYGPSLPGQQLGANLPYLFDFCLCLRIGQEEDGERFRYLQCESDIQYIAKARGGRLDFNEAADLGALFEKALSDEIQEKKVRKPKVENPESEPEEEKVLEVDGSFEEEDEDSESVDGGEDQEEASEVDEEEIVEDSSDEAELVEEDAEEDVQEGDDESLDESGEIPDDQQVAEESAEEDPEVKKPKKTKPKKK